MDVPLIPKPQARLYPLDCAIQHYPWGGYDFIPKLLGGDNLERKPCAELWIGAHPQAPSQVLGLAAQPPSLLQLVEGYPSEILGAGVSQAFRNQLPYLLKILDARQMLSIQAHPNRDQAEAGFNREQQLGIDIKSPQRNYKDSNPKPEVHVALTEFWMLHGFRPWAEIAATLAAEPGWQLLAAAAGRHPGQAKPGLESQGDQIRSLYCRIMTLPQAEIDQLLRPLAGRLQENPPGDKNHPDYWAYLAMRDFPLPGGHLDRGIFSIYLLNLVHLLPGQGTYQGAGILHAYLEGVNVELMANSDNVLRGGLTPKHVDVTELMKTLVFSSGTPEILTGQTAAGPERFFATPAREFLLSRIDLFPGTTYAAPPGHSADALIVLEGGINALAPGQNLDLKRGAVLLAPFGVPYRLAADRAPATVFRASVPEVQLR